MIIWNEISTDVPRHSREPSRAKPFAVWLTGLPASGKTTIANALKQKLADRGIRAVLLDSDVMRELLTPKPTYSDEERDAFYKGMTMAAQTVIEDNVPVIIAATGHRRAFRDRTRGAIERFVEVFVDCPMHVCVERDPKGIYKRGHDNDPLGRIPGMHVRYEEPECPEVVVRGDLDTPVAATERIMAELEALRYISTP